MKIIMIQKVITVILTTMMIIKVLVMIIAIKVMTEVMFYSCCTYLKLCPYWKECI